MDQRSKRQRTSSGVDASAPKPAAGKQPQQQQQQHAALTTTAAAATPRPRPPPSPAAAAAAAAARPQLPPPPPLGPGVQAPLSEFRAAAVPFLVGRLVDARSPEAATLALRPSLSRLSREVAALLHEAAALGHNASLLVVGDAGGGKTLAVERALAAVCSAHNAGLPADNPAVGVVRLSGALHGDERGAMAEIARQLCDAFGVTGAAAAAAAAAGTANGAAGGGAGNAAQAAAAAHMFARAASFGDNLAFLAELLSRLHAAMKAVVFVLDEAEAYVRPTGHGGGGGRQVVLYNLLDALQRSGVRAAVVGVTTHWDLVEGMEKRVRSRFESRTLVVTPLVAPAAAEAAEAGAKEAAAKAAAAKAAEAAAEAAAAGEQPRQGRDVRPPSLPSARRAADDGRSGSTGGNNSSAAGAATAAAAAQEAAAAAEAAAADARRETPSALLRAMLSLPEEFEPRHHAATHNASVRRALDAEPVRRALAEAADAGATPREVGGLAVTALVRAAGRAASAGSAAMVDASDVLAAVRAAREAQDGRATAVTALSVLECALLAAAARVEERAAAAALALGPGAGTAAAGVGATGGGGGGGATAVALAALPIVNFEAVYDEFSRATLRGSEFDHLRSKPAAWRAFRDLVAAGLAEFCGGGSGGGGGGGGGTGNGTSGALTLPYAPVQLLLHRKDLDQGLARHQLCPAWLKRYLEG